MRVRTFIPAFLFRREGMLFLLALALGLAACLLLYLSRPTVLTVAVAPPDGPEHRLFAAFADALKRDGRNVRLVVRSYEDVRDSAAALDRKGPGPHRADLAVARTDVLMPDNGLSVAVLRDEALVVLAPGTVGLKSVPDLARRRLGVVVRHEADLPLITQLLAFYDLKANRSAEAPAPAPGSASSGSAPATVTLVPLRPQDVAGAFEGRRIDAVATIATPSGNTVSDLVRAVEVSAKDRKVAVVGVDEGEALTQRLPALQAVTLPAGILGGRPKRPAEEVKTVGVSYRLLARADLDREVVASLAQYLFEMRARLVSATPSANLLRAPDFDSAVSATSARLPNHAGAVDYFQREQQTFFQRYGDWIYLLMFAGGGIGSAFAWLGQRLAKKRRAVVDVVLDRLVALLVEAREASAGGLDELAGELDGLVVHAVRHARHRGSDPNLMSALVLAINAARAVIADRRFALAHARPSAETVGGRGLAEEAGEDRGATAARVVALAGAGAR